MSATTIPTRINGQRILRSWFNGLRDAIIDIENASSAWTKFTITHEDMQAAALQNDIELFELGEKQLLDAVILKTSEEFAGTSITSYVFDVGLVGELDRYASNYDADAAVGNSNFQAQAFNLELQSFSAATSVRIRATSIGADLDASTAGILEVWVKRSTLP